MLNVAEVDQRGLCLECGSCAGVCPHMNIKLQPDNMGRYRIKIADPSKCIKCPRFCLSVCPGHEIDMDALNQQVFGKLPEDYWSGNAIQSYLGFSTNNNIISAAASGGIVSSLLIHALEKELIDGVFLLQQNEGDPFNPKLNLVSTADQVVNAAGSYYWPAPIGQQLKAILRSKQKFAFVGLPCEIQALRKAQARFTQLNERIVFTIGLFCGGRTTIAGQKYAMSRYGIKSEGIARLVYRHGEWPGHLWVQTKDGREIQIQKNKQLQGYTSQLICHRRCLFCHDPLADLADISTGDALRLDDFRLQEERSILLARTEIGLKLLEDAANAGKLKLRRVDTDKVLHSQKRPILHKKQALWSRIATAEKAGLNVPSINLTKPADIEVSSKPSVREALVILLSRMGDRKFFLMLYRLLPLKLLRRHSFFNRYS